MCVNGRHRVGKEGLGEMDHSTQQRVCVCVWRTGAFATNDDEDARERRCCSGLHSQEEPPRPVIGCSRTHTPIFRSVAANTYKHTHTHTTLVSTQPNVKIAQAATKIEPKHGRNLFSSLPRKVAKYSPFVQLRAIEAFPKRKVQQAASQFGTAEEEHIGQTLFFFFFFFFFVAVVCCCCLCVMYITVRERERITAMHHG